MSARTVDAVVVGGGHNGLVAAALLARAGHSVELLERNAVAGGAIATDELTAPGYRHDTFSSWHPLFTGSAAFAELGDELAARGLAYCNTDAETAATLRPDGEAVIAYRDPERTADAFGAADRARYLGELEALGGQFERIGGLLGSELYSTSAIMQAIRLGRALGGSQRLPFTANVLGTLRTWLAGYERREIADLYSPWLLHTGHTPDGAGGGFQTLATAATLHALGLPTVAGGASRFVDAFVRLIEDNGGVVRTGVDVTEIVTSDGRAVAVRAGDEQISVRRAVIANVTPTQLYGSLLRGDDVPATARDEARRFRYNARAGGQMHIALSEPPRWRDERLARVPLVHLSGGLDDVTLACGQAAAGLLPARATMAVGQPTVLDPTRAPDGGAILWIQLQELPYEPRGDAAGEIEVDPAAGWSDELVEAYADRIVARLGEHIENVPSAVVGRLLLSPAELERRNVNLVRGDIYSGDPEPAQSYLWRPLPSHGSHQTPIDGLLQCGASTYPGAGLNAASGWIAAQRVIADAQRRRPRWRRVTRC